MKTPHADFSVIVPLYNKEHEIRDTLLSALGQTLPPREIVVVDDGSTDGGAAVVQSIGSPQIRLITQPNAGESAARNRAIAEAKGEYVALLDADDTWEPGFLEEIARLIERYPGCGMYCTGFHLVGPGGRFPGRTPEREGVVERYFRTALSRSVATASSVAIPRSVFGQVGDFPVGMRLGADQYMWIKIARAYPVCFSPKRLMNYNLTAMNRSSAIYTPERTDFDFRDFYTEGPDADHDLNEYIAKIALNKAITVSAKGGTEEGRAAERFYRYTRANRRAWRKLFVVNRLPRKLRLRVLAAYNRLAWRIARKGV